MAYNAKLKSIKALCSLQSKYFVNVSWLSTKPAPPAIQESLPVLNRTTENNPIHHSKDHIGKFYTMPPEVKSHLFLSGGIPQKLETQIKAFRDADLMIREPAVEIISYLKKINYSNPAVRFVIYGRNGTGKTTTLMHVLHYGYTSKFLLVHLPWVSNWTKRPKEVVASQYNEKRIDLPVESAIWLQHFKLQNSQLLKELGLKTTKSYTWSVREVTEQGSPLEDIVEHGIQRVRHSSDCVAALLKEIKLLSQAGKCKTLVVVDGVNAFWSKTNVKRPDRTLVPANEITVVLAFMKALQNDWNNAAIVTSVDIVPHNRNYTMQDAYTPHALLGKEGFELLDPFIPIHTDAYSEKEMNSVLDYYCNKLWITSEKGRSEEGRKQIKFLSGYNPFEVMRICDPL